MENKELVLIEACQRGDSEAFGQLYDRYFKKIYSFIYYKVSQKETTEDLVSDIFIKVLANINKFDSQRGNFSSWLYRIARNTVIDYYRVNKQVYNLDNIIELSSEDNLDNSMDVNISLEEVKQKLYKLKEQQQDIIILRVWQQLSYKEISDIVGKSEASCKMVFARSIKELRLSLLTMLWLAILIN